LLVMEFCFLNVISMRIYGCLSNNQFVRGMFQPLWDAAKFLVNYVEERAPVIENIRGDDEGEEFFVAVKHVFDWTQEIKESDTVRKADHMPLDV
jgi:hypothetical protein